MPAYGIIRALLLASTSLTARWPLGDSEMAQDESTAIAGAAGRARTRQRTLEADCDPVRRFDSVVGCSRHLRRDLPVRHRPAHAPVGISAVLETKVTVAKQAIAVLGDMFPLLRRFRG